MLAGCIALPLVPLLFFGNGGGWSGNRLLLGILAICIGSHVAMMFGGRGGKHAHGAEQSDTIDELPAREKDTHGDWRH